MCVASALLAGALAAPATAPAEHSVPELLSTGPGPDGGSGAFLIHASPDGRRVLFTTDSALVPEDVDNCDQPEFEEFRRCYDGYQRFGGATSLLTTGPTDPHGATNIRLEAASRDASRAFFSTSVPLVPEDTNGTLDVYERSAGATRLVSTGPSGPAHPGAFLTGVSEDGSRVFFFISGRLVAQDEDNCTDLYERSAGTTKLVSTGVPPGTFIPPCALLHWGGTSADGSRVFLHTEARVTSDDTDDDWDIYEWSDTGVALVSTGPADHAAAGGFPDRDFSFAISRDGRHVFFRTTEQLVVDDTDTDPDLYERVDGTTRLVVPPVQGDSSPHGFFNAMSEDASRVFFTTAAGVAPEDIDGADDVYERVGGEYRLVSTGPLGSAGRGYWAGPFPGQIYDHNYGGVSADGRAVLFASLDPFVPEDTDHVQDIYLRANGETKLVSTGPNDVNRSFLARVGDVILSPDGSRVFFMSNDPLVPEDTDANTDVYEWHAGRTTLVPHGVPTPEPVGLGLDSVLPQAIVRDGSRVFIGTNSRLTPDDTDNESDLYAVDLNRPPNCDQVAADPNMLWPATRRFVTIALSGATDPDSHPVSLDITGVTQDEPPGTRDAAPGNTGSEVRLRAEREPRGDGRVYRITFEATDGHGASCSGNVEVTVPRHRRRAAQDSAPPSYDSFGN